MNTIFSLDRKTLLRISSILFITLLTLIALSFIDHSKLFSLALSLDFIITFPLIYYILIRKHHVSKLTVIPFITIGYIAAKIFIHADGQLIIEYYPTVVFPIIETFVFMYILLKAIKYSKKVAKQELDFYDSVLKVSSETLPRLLAHLISLEISSIYYAFFKWKTEKLKPSEFSYHKKSGIIAILFAFIFLILVETIALHILLIEWNFWITWLLTITSLYTIIQITAISKGLLNRPITIDNEEIMLRYSFLKKTRIKVQEIEDIQLRRTKPESEGLQTLSPFGDLESFNTVIFFKQNQIMENAYGKISTYNVLCLSLDKAEEFINVFPNYQKPAP
jgi:hypothetical protein